MAQKLSYKGVVWDYNPKTLKITYERDIHTFSSPLVSDIVQDGGISARVVSGEGELFGENGKAVFSGIEALWNAEGSGKLSLPSMKPFFAYFKKLEWQGAAGIPIVSYRFEFIEDPLPTPENPTYSRYYHLAKNGETLWQISAFYNIPIETLLVNNPHISSPNDNIDGERIRL